MKHAVIITENKYPCEDAGAIRQHATAKILQELGYSVTVLGYGKPTGKHLLVYDGVNYISFRPTSNNVFIRLVYRALFGLRALMFIYRKCSDTSLILVVDTLPYAMKAIARYAWRRNITLVHDSVEWYSPEEYPDGERNREYRFKEKTNRVLIGKGWRVMAISRYLQDHFSKVCDRVVRIPVIMDVANIEYRTDLQDNIDKTHFVYAGGPGRKDYLKEIVEAFCLLDKMSLQNLELHIIGVNEEQLKSVCGVSETCIESLGNALVVHGRIPHEEAVHWVREADYTLLFRDSDLRYAKAGFPTKIVESLSCGTPPVCNLSSDLELYLQNGLNAIIAEGFAPEQIKEALIRALECSKNQRIMMRSNARRTACECFDYHQYVDVMDWLIKNKRTENVK